MARGYALDAFGTSEEFGLENLDEAKVAELQQTGRRCRNKVLAMGGVKVPMDIFEPIWSREPTPEALLIHSGLAKSFQYLQMALIDFILVV